MTQKKIIKNWIPGKYLGLDEIQYKFGSRYAKFSFICDGNKPLRDYIKIIKFSESTSGYLLRFTVDTRGGLKVSDLLYDKLHPVREQNTEYKYMVSIDRFYTSVDNCMMLNTILDMMMLLERDSI